MRALLPIAALLLAAACGSDPATPDVLLVGDSNIAMRPVAVRDGFDGFDIDNRGVPGAGIRAGTCATCTQNDWSAELRDVEASAVIVNLGINDALFPGGPDTQGYADYGAKIDWLLRQLPDAPVYWSNLPCPLEPADWREGCAVINRELAAADARFDRLTVVDWSAAAPPDAIPPGDVHLTFDATTAWAELMASHLERTR